MKRKKWICMMGMTETVGSLLGALQKQDENL